MNAFDAAMLKWQAETREQIVDKHSALLDQAWLAGCRLGVRLTCRHLGNRRPSLVGDEMGILGVSDD